MITLSMKAVTKASKLELFGLMVQGGRFGRGAAQKIQKSVRLVGPGLCTIQCRKKEVTWANKRELFGIMVQGLAKPVHGHPAGRTWRRSRALRIRIRSTTVRR